MDVDLDEIDDPRNGLLVEISIRNLSENYLALLRLPNFASNCGDVPCNRPELPDDRLVLQGLNVSAAEALVEPIDGDVIDAVDLQSPIAPSPLLTDFAYGALALRHWATSHKHHRTTKRPSNKNADIDLLVVSLALQGLTYEEEMRKIQSAKMERCKRTEEAARVKSIDKVTEWLSDC